MASTAGGIGLPQLVHVTKLIVAAVLSVIMIPQVMACNVKLAYIFYVFASLL